MNAPCGCPVDGGMIRHQRGICTDPVVVRLDWYAGPSQPDLSAGLIEQASYVSFLVGEWHDFGYETPPSPECNAIPPLGERSAKAITAGHKAIKEIDELGRRLHALRAQLIGELRQDEDIRMDRTGRMLAESRERLMITEPIPADD